MKHKVMKATGNLRIEMNKLTGEQSALQYFTKSNRISRENFQTVWWNGMENLMKSYPKMFQLWLTKHVSGGCVRDKKGHTGSQDGHPCPSFGNIIERTSHVTRCRELGRKKVLRSAVGELSSGLDV